MATGDQQLRREYRQLIEQVEEEAETLSDVGNTELLARLHETRRLYQQVGDQCVTEAAMDSHLLANLARIVRRRVFACDTNLITFRPLEFADHLARRILDETDETTAWTHFGGLVSNWVCAAPSLQILQGTLPEAPADPAVKKQRAPRQKRGPLAPLAKPDEVTEVDQQEATRKQVNLLNNVLKSLHRKMQRPLGFFEFAYHPTSFNTTVENVFHIAFLVREKLARVYLDASGLPVIEPMISGGCDGAQHEDPAAATTVNNQVLYKLTQDQWKQVVRTFEIRKPLIPSLDGKSGGRSGSSATSSAGSATESQPGPSGVTTPSQNDTAATSQRARKSFTKPGPKSKTRRSPSR